MTGKLLKQLCHQHGIFSTRNADCNFITILHQFIFSDCLRKPSPDRFAEFLDNASFNVLCTLFRCIVVSHHFAELHLKPCTIAIFDAVDFISLFCQLFCDFFTLLTGITKQVNRTVFTYFIHMRCQFLPVNIDRTRISLLLKIRGITDIYDLLFSCIFL